MKQICDMCGQRNTATNALCRKCDKQLDIMIQTGLHMALVLKMAVDYTILHGIETGKYELKGVK